MEFILTYILPFALTLGVLILVHELGHFTVAKLVGIRVERFSIGFPPRLFGKKLGETDYCISAVPLGGYVKMAGMIDESMDKDGLKGEPWEFMSKPLWARFLAIFAGPAFNVLFAVLVFTVSIMSTGIETPVEPTYSVVGTVIEGQPADNIGLQAGDRIVAINGQKVEKWEEIVQIIHAHPEEELTIKWERDGEIFTNNVTPRLDKLNDVGLIGISPVTEQKPVGFFAAIGYGFESTYNLTALMFKSFGMLFSGEVSAKEGLAGPVRIAKMTGDSAKSGLSSLVIFAALLSVNLGLINLFPIPALDGGHLVLLAVEGVIRKPLSTRVKMIIQQIGLALLFALMIFVVFNDMINILN